MSDPLADLIHLEAKLAQYFRGLAPKILGSAKGVTAGLKSGDFADANYKLPCYLLAHLYQFPHPANALQGQEWCADLATDFVDHWVDGLEVARRQGQRTNTSEWPIYATLAVQEFLGVRLDERRRERWRAFVENYCREESLVKPFGQTAPNHEAWRMLGLYRAGQVLGHPAWSEQALFFARQLLEYQTAEGFWEEGRHHGPSMRYNNVCLAGLALLFRHSGDAQVGEAAKRLAEFMSTYSYPDGTTVGAFDGRQSTSLGYYAPVVPGFELAATGRTLNARALELWRRIGRLEDVRLFSNSLWYGAFSSMFYGAACHYYSALLPASERAGAIADGGDLPADRDGVVENHSATFDGLIQRHGAWAVALSSQNSDVPILGSSIYRLDRQSRLELWHREAGLLLGGGHNRRDWSVPYANAVVDTGFAGATEFGRLGGEETDLQRRYIVPRWARSRIVQGCPELTLIFGHARISFRLETLEDRRCAIEATWEQRGVQRLCLQLPLIVWHGARLWLDGQAQDEGDARPRLLEREARSSGGPFGFETVLRVPEGVPCRVHYPFILLRDYGGGPSEDHEMIPPFCMALASCQWTQPPQEGRARFEVELRGLGDKA